MGQVPEKSGHIFIPIITSISIPSLEALEFDSHSFLMTHDSFKLCDIFIVSIHMLLI